jgi:hypothetical protein
MDFVNITHNLETLSKEQELDFRIVETLLSNLNSVKPPHVPVNTLKYKNKEFVVVSLGFAHRFLLEDIEKALLGNLESHKEFIIQEVRKQLTDYSRNRSATNYLNTKEFLHSLMNYYGNNYPVYSDNDDFKIFIEGLNIAIGQELVK